MFFATQAREGYPYYQHEEIGYNYRMSDVIAGVVRGQFPHLKEHIEAKSRKRSRTGSSGTWAACASASIWASPRFVPLLIKITMPGPVFFRQERAGKGGRPFMILKFRSMKPDRQAEEKHEFAKDFLSRVLPL